MSWRQGDFDVVLDLRNPLDAVQRHAVFVLENAAHPEHGAGHQCLHTDLAAFQIGGLADALGGVDEHEAVPEPAMQEYRNGAEWHVVVTRREIGRTRQLGDVEFAAVQETPVPRRRIHVGEDGQIDAVDLDFFIQKRTDDFIVTAGECECEFLWHTALSTSFRGARIAREPGIQIPTMYLDSGSGANAPSRNDGENTMSLTLSPACLQLRQVAG